MHAIACAEHLIYKDKNNQFYLSHFNNFITLTSPFLVWLNTLISCSVPVGSMKERIAWNASSAEFSTSRKMSTEDVSPAVMLVEDMFRWSLVLQWHVLEIIINYERATNKINGTEK